MDRLFNTMTVDELETFEAGGNLPETLLNRPSKSDKLDRKSLFKRWKEADRICRGRRLTPEFTHKLGKTT
jgi:hypothetical protein